jgi:LuxR family maltose regulon positive regulatory protein
MMNDESETISPHRSSFAIPRSNLAWLSLDENDNDPVRFLSHLIAALQIIQPGLGEAALAMLHPYPQPYAIWQSPELAECQDVLVTLINEVAAIPEAFMLVLDDYHLINTPAIHEALTCLLDHLPPQMHLLIASRSEPPLPLARLRARSQLLEIGRADLRFTPDEVALFLNQVMGLSLSAADVVTLENRTEGWIAGLQMAALSMQDCRDIPGFMATFTGTHRYIFDYLAEEVLQRQPQAIQNFLLRTSILNRLTAPLCEAILGQGVERPRGQLPKNASAPSPPALPASSQEMLEHLEHANLFVIPLDDRRAWYRYHHLLADFLRDALQRQITAQEVATLHRRAAAWYEQNDLTAEAVAAAE